MPRSAASRRNTLSTLFVAGSLAAALLGGGAGLAADKPAEKPAPAKPADKPAPTKGNIPYGPHPNQLLDIYLPPSGDGPYPALVWFGGLWKPSKGAPNMGYFASNGCAEIAVQTRVMQDAIEAKIEPPVSVCMLDACRAVQYVRLHAKELNIDPARIVVGGGSQGALPALYVGCVKDRANPDATDPVERTSTRVLGVAAFRCQPSIDPARQNEWMPGVEWGAPALGCSYAESVKKRDSLMPWITAWSPDYLLHEGSAPIYFENEWGLTQPNDEKVTKTNYMVHCPQFGLGFRKLAEAKGVVCYNKYLEHPSEKYKDTWDFLVQTMKGGK